MAQKPMDKYTTNTAESVKLLSELECGCNVNIKRNISHRILYKRQSAKILPIRIEFMKKMMRGFSLYAEGRGSNPSHDKLVVIISQQIPLATAVNAPGPPCN